MSLAQVLKSVVAQYDAENLLKMREKVLHLMPFDCTCHVLDGRVILWRGS